MKKFLVPLLAFASLAQVAFAANTLGSLKGTIPVGRNLSVALGTSPSGSWYIVNNSKPSVAFAVIFGENLLANGLSAGTTNLSVCTEISATNCMDVEVTVGGVLGANTQTHPVGSWVILDKTVFYVHATGLIPIPTWEIFLSNGGRASKIVPANEADLNLPLLPLMTLKDSRVK